MHVFYSYVFGVCAYAGMCIRVLVCVRGVLSGVVVYWLRVCVLLVLVFEVHNLSVCCV